MSETGFHSTHDGWIEVITGVMFSGKSEELLRRVRRALIAQKRVQLFKSHLDARFAGIHSISTHDGTRVEAVPVMSSLDIAERVKSDSQVVAIDEVQFLDAGVAIVADALAERGIRVICAGTDLDFCGEPFGPIAHLMAIAESVDKLHAVCARCGQPATRNQRLIDGHPAPAEGPVIQVGGKETYEARCRRCHEVPSLAQAQTSFL